MLKKIIINIILGGALFLFGVFMHDELKIRNWGEFVAGCGVFYAIISTCFILLKQAIPFVNKFINETLTEREKNKAHTDLLKYKKLFDEKIITQEEFLKKSEVLKSKLL